jgi:Tol biopolymer transport system component
MGKGLVTMIATIWGIKFMIRLKPIFAIMPFLLAGLGAFLLAGMLTSRPEPERLPLAYVIENDDYPNHFDLRVIDILSGDMLYEVNSPDYDCPDEISSDGQWLLYGQSDNEVWRQQSTLVNLKTRESVALPPDHVGIGAKIWEEDGLIYISRRVERGESIAQGIYRYDFATGEIQFLATGILDAELEFTGVQSSEGELYNVLREEEFVTVRRGSNEIVSIETSGSILFSHDGRFLTDTYANTTYVRSTDDGDELDIVFPLRESPRWNPTSNVLAYLALDALLMTYNADTLEQKPSRLQNSPYGIIHVWDWSPDGRYIPYQVVHGDEWFSKNYDLFVLDTLTGESSEIARNIAGDWQYLPWVGDNYLVYSYADIADGYTDAAGNYHRPNRDIWLYHVATGENIQLTSTPDINEEIRCWYG